MQEQGIGFWNISSLALFPISHSIEEGRGQCVRYGRLRKLSNQNVTVIYQLTGHWIWGDCVGVTVKLYMCTEGVHCTLCTVDKANIWWVH